MFMKRKSLSLLMAVILAFGVPAGAFAADENTDDKTIVSESTDLTEPENVPTVDLKEAGYEIKLAGGDSYEYTGKEIKPEFEIVLKDGGKEEILKLEEDVDYTAEYKNNVEISSESGEKPSVTVTMKEENSKGFTGSLTKEFEITKPQTPEETQSKEETPKEPSQETEPSETPEPVVPGKPVVSSTSSYSAVTVKWGKVAGASGYRLYRSTSKNSGYKIIQTIASAQTCSYADKNTVFNKTYYYKVEAYTKADGKTIYGPQSAVRAQKKTIAAPSITKVSAGPGTAKLTWKKVSGASLYVVYRSTAEGGKYKRVAKIKKASTTSYKDMNLSGQKTYYYKVKAFRTVKKKNYAGPASPAKAVTTKKFEGGWRYVNGYKLYYDKNGKLVKDVSSILGKRSSYVIKVNKKKNCVTVYAKDGKNGYIIPVKAFVCSAGNATPITTARTPSKYRWHALNGNCYGQWCTRIKQGFLFHSVMYGRTKNTTLSVSNYNKLGRTASHGCIRLRAGDAKWIYDNCKLKTKVIIYNSSNPGPLGKPSAVKLPKWHKWDPTDPTAKYKCKRRGCH